jgi:hypothetical protein
MRFCMVLIGFIMVDFASNAYIADGEGDCSPVNHPMANLVGFVVPEGTKMFGKPASTSSVLAFAVKAGFNPATNYGRYYSGMIPIVLPDGSELGLCWDDPPSK